MCDVKFVDASNWTPLPWLQSGGTRSKTVLQNELGEEYYFKKSERKPAVDNKAEKYYKYEFWSEVIAYQIGKSLDLDILRYDVGLFDGELGCISPLMIDRDSEELIEVGRYMMALNPEFLPETNLSRKEYTFQLLSKTLDGFSFAEYWDQIFKTLLFDTIIGNTDRHQENWAFIGNATYMAKALDEVEDKIKKTGLDKLPWWLRVLCSPIFDSRKNELNQDGKYAQLQLRQVKKMAPIYDSGSSLCRELPDDKVEEMLLNQSRLDKYILGGLSELHWDKIKQSHFKLIENIYTSSYNETLLNSASFINNWDESKIEHLINKVDVSIPEEWSSYKIPEQRKELLIKVVNLRLNKLREVLNG